MKTSWGRALVIVGSASIAGGIALGWFALWLGGQFPPQDMAWIVQLSFGAFALLFTVAGVIAVLAGARSR